MAKSLRVKFNYHFCQITRVFRRYQRQSSSSSSDRRQIRASDNHFEMISAASLILCKCRFFLNCCGALIVKE
jgi:hypothetical protein